MMRTRREPTYITTWIVWYAIALHLIWGIALIYSPIPAGVTGLHALVGGDTLRFTVGGGLLLIGAAAAYGLTFEKRQPYFSALLLIPQQFTLMLSAGEAIKVILHSSTADGIARPQAFLIAGLAPIILMAVFHSLAVLDHTGVLRSRFWSSLLRKLGVLKLTGKF